MPWKLTNIALDPTSAYQRRRAPRMEMEPVIGGLRVKLRQSYDISDAAYQAAERQIKHHISQGVLKAENLNGSSAPSNGATPKKKRASKPKAEAAPKKTRKKSPPKKVAAEVPIAPLPPPPVAPPVPVAAQNAKAAPTPTTPAVEGEG